MRYKKYKRSLFGKVPYIILSLFIIFGLTAAIFFASQFVLSKQGAFISPLSQNKIAKNASLENILYKNNIPFLKIEIATDSSYVIFLRDQGVVNLDSQKNVKNQISSLQLILSRLTIEGKKFKRLDLRYELPIIEF